MSDELEQLIALAQCPAIALQIVEIAGPQLRQCQVQKAAAMARRSLHDGQIFGGKHDQWHTSDYLREALDGAAI